MKVVETVRTTLLPASASLSYSRNTATNYRFIVNDMWQ